jgi:tetratricopeptide (TPR) repeat protein
MPRRLALAAVFLLLSCTKPEGPAPPRPSILLVTLDTTRADAIGPATPSINALMKRGRVFRQAYATVPQTLPSHTSMLTGLYPAGHAIHENARFLSGDHPVLAGKLHDGGYRTAAFVSSFALARRFGLARGFDVYDEEEREGRAERSAAETTERAMALLDQPVPGQPPAQPLFLWVHYYDPHYPYTPPEPYRTRYAANPYLGEVAAMDEQLGRLVRAFERHANGPAAILVVADHGEGLGEHGEAQHGNLLYQSTMHVPLILVGPGVTPGTRDVPVSTRRIFHTILDWAGLGSENSLRAAAAEIVMGEAMKPFLDFGWQPQVMAVEGRTKTIRAGSLERYDVLADPAEAHDLKGELSRPVRKALNEYPLPSLDAPSTENLSDEERRKLASLGYVASEAKPVVRKNAPRPVDMAFLFPILDKASGLFVREQYAEAIPLLEKIRAVDPDNLDAALRLASAHSALGHDQQALDAFRQAQSIAPTSPDVRTYLALHYARGKEWPRAVPLLEQIVAEWPDRLPPLEALAVIRERQGRVEDAIRLRQKIYTLRAPRPAELVRLGEMAMATGRTDTSIDAFEQARAAQDGAFDHDLELGVLYLSAHRFEEARASLDRVPEAHPAHAMVLFKRAQVSVLLHEPDSAARIERARREADATTRELIAHERLFGVQ